MTHQQELELLAKWMGIKNIVGYDHHGLHIGQLGSAWNPSPTGNSDDFLNMVAGRVDFEWVGDVVLARHTELMHMEERADIADHNNDKVAAMKHAAYQVCLMAAREGKE